MVLERLLGKVHSFFEGVTHHERVKSPIQQAHFLEEVTGFLMHVRGDKHVGDLFKLVLLDTDVIGKDYVGGLGGETASQVQGDSRVEVTLLLLDFSSFRFLTGLKEL